MPSSLSIAVPHSPPASAPAPERDLHIDRFFQRLSAALDQGRLEKVVLANYAGDEPQLQRVLIRPVVLRDQPHLSFVYRYQTKDITKNVPLAQAAEAIAPWLGPQAFKNAHLHLPGEEVQLAFSKKGKATLRVGKPQAAGDRLSAIENNAGVPATSGGSLQAPQDPVHPSQGQPHNSHNREKHRFLDLARPFLTELGVTDAQGQLIPAMSRKWKQINKFIEVFSHALARSPLAQARPVHVVDFGSGKGYLTFAIHDYLRHVLKRDARVTGVELREDLVKLCTRVIDSLRLEGMAYEQGDVRHYHPAELNVMIALHACDVATDYAIHLGIRSGAEIIMCSPCCHKQIRPQLLSPHPLRPILQHGIHLGQEAEMLTDGLRALLLEAAGYDTQVFEFISLEHTNKNKMILAVKRAQVTPAEPVLTQIEEIKAFYGIKEQCLESLLVADGLIG